MTTAERLPRSAVTLGTSGLGESASAADSAGSERSVGSPTPDEIDRALALLRSAYPLIDTSNMYAGGRSEEVLGAAIARLGGIPAGCAVLSKADRDPVTGGFDRDRVWRSFEESTQRLGVERLPVYQLHDPYTVTFAQAMGSGGAVEGLIELRDQGLIDHIGIAAGPLALLTDYVRTGAFDVLLTHNRYTVLDRSGAALIAESTERGLMVFNAAPFGGGLLANGSRNRTHYGYRPASPEMLNWVEQFRDLCGRYGVGSSAVALHFSLRNAALTSTVVGISSRKRLSELDDLIAAEIPTDLWDELDLLGTPPSTLND